ncbi:MAG: 30S ribosomal protein S8 [Anaerolineae bacterium]|nr:30S ribosomal protein S8 [Anaerolineae bacterium]
MYSDTVADMLTRIRNGLMAGHTTTSIPHSKLKVEIARILQEEGYIEGYEVVDDPPGKALIVTLKYWGDRRRRRPVISGIERVSKPGRRVYRKRDELPWVLSGMGIAIVTTSQGLMTAQDARRKGIGGEVICRVW